MTPLEAAYAEACDGKSDISEHVPTLRALAAQCRHVTEFGVRKGVSTVSLLAGVTDSGGVLVSYDKDDCKRALDHIDHAARERWRFHRGDSLRVTIAPTDLLFIDTVHDGTHLLAELERHTRQVRRLIVLHDTVEFCGSGDSGGEGMLVAVGRFLERHGGWRVAKHYRNCHGLTVLERMKE